MHRHTTFFVKKFDEIQTCNGPMFQVIGSAFEKPFQVEYFKDEKHNLDNCESCKQTHQSIIQNVDAYWKRFPFCCVQHRNLLKASWFKREYYNGISQQVADKVIFCHHHMINNIDKGNWKVEISNYLDYVVQSFGQFPEGFGEPVGFSRFIGYLTDLVTNVKYEKHEVDLEPRRKEVLNLIIAYTQPGEKKDTDMNLLVSTYTKWYKSFPFDLPFFAHLKEPFSKFLPIISGTPVYNPYLKIAKASSQTQSGMVEFLLDTTNQILSTIDTSQLSDDEFISNQTKISLELHKKHHSLNQGLLLKQYSKGEKRYVKTIKKWLENEKVFIAGIMPLIKSIPSTSTRQNKLPKAFMFAGAEYLDEPVRDFFDVLQSKSYVSKDSKTDFIKAFTEKEPKNKVVWTGQFGDLKSLISYLIQEGKIKKPGSNHWQLSAKLFTRLNGGDFANDEIKDTKTTANDNLILDLIKKL